MHKIVIYNNNLETIKKSCNIISKHLDNIDLLEIATSKSEFINMCKNTTFNIVFLSENDKNSKEIQNYLNNIEFKIFFCNYSNKNISSKYNLYLPIDISDEFFYNKLKSFLSKTNERNIQQRVHTILQNYNFDFKLKGTNYLAEAICYSYLHRKEYLYDNLEHNIYPHVATYFGVNYSTVKWAIVRALNNMNIKLSSSNSKKEINYYANFGDKITPKLFISDIVNSI